MVISSEKCNRRDARIQEGKGIIHIKDLADKAGMYDHGRMFAHIVIDPGCSLGYHEHHHETEFYYIIKGEGLFNDNGTGVMVHTGDVCVTGSGAGHSLENCTEEPLEMIALVVME